MTEWLKLSDTDRRLSLNQASAKSGLPVKAIEKDWWVTLVLKSIFESKFSPYVLFKGGTSLSKCWGLIHRFSEDIDLSIERDLLGFSENLSKSQVKKLKRVAALFTSTDFKSSLEQHLLNLGVSSETFSITAEPIPETMKDTDPQTLYINYHSMFDGVDYITDSVKVEVSARSLKEKGVEKPVVSMLGEYMSGYNWSEDPVMVSSVLPERTFLEKIFLLHEEFLRTSDKVNYNRMSRHLYDLEKMMDTEYGIRALSSFDYYNSIVKHRRKFIFKQGVDYDTHHPQTLSFLPPESVTEHYRHDYAQMVEQMIYGDGILDFEAMIDRLLILLDRIRKLTDKH